MISLIYHLSDVPMYFEYSKYYIVRNSYFKHLFDLFPDNNLLFANHEKPTRKTYTCESKHKTYLNIIRLSYS